MNHHDALDFGMFWTGALFAFTPIIGATIVLAVWWFNRRRQSRDGAPPGRDAGRTV